MGSCLTRSNYNVDSFLAANSQIYKECPERAFFNIIFFPKIIQKLELLFRASEHSFSSSLFHKKCDNQGPLLIFAKTKEGRVFGGYIGIGIDKNKKGFFKAPMSFIFSLDKKAKIPLINPDSQFAVYVSEDSGPSWGCGPDLCIGDGCDKNLNSKSTLGVDYNLTDSDAVLSQGSEKTRTFLAGYNEFNVYEYEVFKISFQE